MKLELEVFEDDEGNWGLRINDKEVYCGDLLADIDNLLSAELRERVLDIGDTLTINLK